MTHDTIDQARLDRLERLTTPRLTRLYRTSTDAAADDIFTAGLPRGNVWRAAGGGKSDALLMAALQYVDVPDLCRSSTAQVLLGFISPGSTDSRAQEWLRR